MVINCKKTMCMTFLIRFKSNRWIDVIPNFMLGGTLIDFCDSFLYLGHIICNTLDDKADVLRDIRFISFRCNRLCYRFYYFSLEVKKTLWNSYVNCFYWIGILNISNSLLNFFVRGYFLCMKNFLVF